MAKLDGLKEFEVWGDGQQTRITGGYPASDALGCKGPVNLLVQTK